jgi:PTH2 family peptidyl-tRNA hydrolase
MVKQVLVVRRDLNMRKGKMSAQCAHASLGSVTQFMAESIVSGGYYFFPPKDMQEWLFDGPFIKIVVGCDDEEELLQLEQVCKEAGVIHRLIQDAGRTEFHGEPTYTVLAVGPGETETIDKITGHLKLL